MDFRLHKKQSLAFRSTANEILYGGAAGGGKALAVDTPIPTNKGWKMMGDVIAGDVVYDDSGNPCNVIAATEIMHGRPCYRVVFSDGEEIVADANHQWLAYSLSEREALRRLTPEFREKRRKKRAWRGAGVRPDLAIRNSENAKAKKTPPEGSIYTTKEMAETQKCRGRNNYAVRVCPGIVNPDVSLPIEPYVLGVWLGDGTSSQAAITTPDKEILEEIERRGHTITSRRSELNYGVIGLLKDLRSSGVYKNKHIPPIYLRASEQQRLDLLRGLMDTDGTASVNGSCEFSSTSEILANGVRELLISLGIKANVRIGRAMLYGKDCGPNYRIKFTTPHSVFLLNKKAIRQKKELRGVQGWRVIKAIEPTYSVPVKCIEVDSASHLYLAGRGMIPTHNSHLMRILAIYLSLRVPGVQVYLFRRLSDDLVKNHLSGPTGFESMLSSLSEAGVCKITTSPNTVKFGNGSRIYLCHCQYEKDRLKYQGAEIHVLLIDELTHFTESIYRYLRGRARFPDSLNIPAEMAGRLPLILNGTNPGGVGHNWVKRMFVDPQPPLKIWQTGHDEGGLKRQFIPALLDDNPSLNRIQYEATLSGLGSPHLVKAMRDGDWNIVAGGMFDDVWDDNIHILSPFTIPASWKIDRSFDWGSSKPYSVGWWAESDGSDIRLPDGSTKSSVRGDLFRIGEIYGCSGKPNEGTKETAADIARKIKKYERDILKRNVSPGPADSSIYNTEDGHSIAQNMSKAGVMWTKANKSPGSRINGWELLRQKLQNAKRRNRRPREEPGLFVFSNCRDFIRTIPTLVRDKNNEEDVDTDAEDHIADETRYRVLANRMKIGRL